MKNNKFMKTLVSAMAFTLLLSGCGASSEQSTDAAEVQSGTETTTEIATQVEITDIHGTVTVPVNPERVVSLDNRTFETLSDWGIELAAAPIDVMPADSPYVTDESVQNIGNHREPNLEIIAAVDPELVIVGQRFASYYEDIKALVPNAAVIDLSFDVSETAETPGDNLVNGLKDATKSLALIFDKTKEADQLLADFDQVIADVQASYSGEETVMSVVVSGGDIGFSAPRTGRVWGPMYEIFGWVNALGVDNTTSDHQGDDISVEAIAQSNPDWLLVLDRDAGTNNDESALPAQDVIDNSPALQNITAVTEGKIVYAPTDTYTNESIQTYIELFADLASAFAGN